MNQCLARGNLTKHLRELCRNRNKNVLERKEAHVLPQAGSPRKSSKRSTEPRKEGPVSSSRLLRRTPGQACKNAHMCTRATHTRACTPSHKYPRPNTHTTYTQAQPTTRRYGRAYCRVGNAGFSAFVNANSSQPSRTALSSWCPAPARALGPCHCPPWGKPAGGEHIGKRTFPIKLVQTPGTFSHTNAGVGERLLLLPEQQRLLAWRSPKKFKLLSVCLSDLLKED